MMIRQFFLKNKEGKQLDLNGSTYMYDPSGLGVEHKVTYETIGYNYVPVEDKIQQKKIQGTIRFKSYEAFREFAAFCEAKPLTLIYMTDETYYIDVYPDYIPKSEKEIGGLHCKVRLLSAGLFYKVLTVRNSATEQGKKYPYTYPYTYSDGTISIIELNIESKKECPTKLTIIGPAINPSWNHKVNGQVVTTGKVNVTIEAGQRLVVDAMNIPYGIHITDSAGQVIEDVYQKSDFSTKRFLMLRTGINEIMISHEGTNNINLSLEGRELYEVV